MSTWTDFYRDFELLPAESSEHIARSQRLRYQVYCTEHGFLNPDDYPDQREVDQFEDRAVHTLLRHRQSGEIIATVRMVLADAADPNRHFPIERGEVLRHLLQDYGWAIPRESIGEISRLAVVKEFRLPGVIVGLFKAILAMTARKNVTHWYAVMEPSLLRLLRQSGIKFTPVGPLVDYHGLRQPCVAVAEEVLANVRQHRPAIWDFVTDSGATVLPHKHAKSIQLTTDH